MEAQKQFEEWLERKEQERVDKAAMTISHSLSNSVSPIDGQIYPNMAIAPPWLPTNPTIPKVTRKSQPRSRSAGIKM